MNMVSINSLERTMVEWRPSVKNEKCISTKKDHPLTEICSGRTTAPTTPSIHNHTHFLGRYRILVRRNRWQKYVTNKGGCGGTQWQKRWPTRNSIPSIGIASCRGPCPSSRHVPTKFLCHTTNKPQWERRGAWRERHGLELDHIPLRSYW